jgi:hypothetical protein
MKLIASFILLSVFQLTNSLKLSVPDVKLPVHDVGDVCDQNYPRLCPDGTSCVRNSTAFDGPTFCLKPAELGKNCIRSYNKWTGFLDCAPGLFCKRDCVKCTKDMRPHSGLCVEANETKSPSAVPAKSAETTKVNPSKTKKIKTSKTYVSKATKSKLTKATRSKKSKSTKTKVTNATRTKKTKVTNATRTKKTKVTNATRTKKTKVTNATRTKKSKYTRTDVSQATVVSNSIQKYDTKTSTAEVSEATMYPVTLVGPSDIVTDLQTSIQSPLPSDVDITITSSGMSLSLTGLVGFLIFSVL